MGVGRRGLLYLRRAIPSFRFKMDLRSKLLVDRLVFCPIAHFLNTLTMLTCWLVRRDHSPLQGDAEGRTIVICKFAGMGSIVNATGVIRVLRQYHAGAQIVFFTSRANRPLMQLIPDIDRCLYLDDRNPWRLAVSIAGALGALWRMRVDTYLDLEVYSSFSTIISALSLARNRLGLYNRSVSFRKYLFTHTLVFNLERSMREIYLNLAALASATVWEHHQRARSLMTPLRLLLPSKAQEETERLLAGLGIAPQRATVVNPHASELCLERRWSRESWQEFIHGYLTIHPTHQVLLVGAPAERGYTQEVLDGVIAAAPWLQGRVFNLAGKPSFAAYLHLLKVVGRMVTGDSGPYHFAIAMGARVVSLWGPVNPHHYAWKVEETTIRGHTYCSPCLRQVDTPPCRGVPHCMNLIAADVVLREAERRFFAPRHGYQHVEIEESDRPWILAQLRSVSCAGGLRGEQIAIAKYRVPAAADVPSSAAAGQHAIGAPLIDGEADRRLLEKRSV